MPSTAAENAVGGNSQPPPMLTFPGQAPPLSTDVVPLPAHLLGAPPPPPPPPMFSGHPPPVRSSDEPAAKRQKLDDHNSRLSADEWLAQCKQETVKLVIQVPSNPQTAQQWATLGQELEVNVNVNGCGSDVKVAILAKLPKLPSNKYQLKHRAHGFLKDRMRIAEFNMQDNAKLDMILKRRGRR
jgi:hypothetical protein